MIIANLKCLWIWTLMAVLCSVSHKVHSQVCSDDVDLTIILDSTSDLGPANFELVRQFFNDFMDGQNMQITFGTTRVNYLQYASTFVSSGNYLTSNRRSQTTISDMNYLNGGARDTAGALDYYINNSPTNGRSTKQNVVVLLMVGPSADKDSAIQSAQAIHDRGDDMLVIGVSSDVDGDEIRQLTSLPRVKGQNYFLVSDYTDLDGMASTLAEGLCNRDTPGPITTTSTTTSTQSTTTPTTTTTTTLLPPTQPDHTTSTTTASTTSQKSATADPDVPKVSTGGPVVTVTYTAQSTDMTTPIPAQPLNRTIITAIVVSLLILLIIATIATLICCCRGGACCHTEVESSCGDIHCTESGAACVTSCCSSCCWIKGRDGEEQKSLRFSNIKSSADVEDTALNPEKA